MFRVFLVLMSLHAPFDGVEASLQFWQRVFRLQDWHITVEVVHRDVLSDGTVGRIDTDLRRRTAVIKVLDPRESDLPPDEARADQLVTIAHEMVHLKRLARDHSTDWQDEPTTTAETFKLLQRYHRWVELTVAEP